MQIRSLRSLGKQLPIDLQCLGMLTQCHEHVRMRGAVTAVARVARDQLSGFLECPGVPMTLQEHAHIVVACGLIGRGVREHALEQEVRIIEHLELHTDLCKEPHGLHIGGMGLQEFANDALSLVDLSVGKQARRRHDGGWQRRKLRHVARRGAGVLGSTRRAKQHFQRLPTRGQGGIHVHGAQKRIERGARLCSGEMTVATLLVQPAVGGVHRLQSRERCQRVIDITQIALTHGDEIEDVPILWDLGAERLGA